MIGAVFANLLNQTLASDPPLAQRLAALSGRTVRPRLIITCGVSGAIQFKSCMNCSERIVAINTDADAPIFDVAHVAIVGDLYPILRGLIARLKEAVA